MLEGYATPIIDFLTIIVLSLPSLLSPCYFYHAHNTRCLICVHTCNPYFLLLFRAEDVFHPRVARYIWVFFLHSESNYMSPYNRISRWGLLFFNILVINSSQSTFKCYLYISRLIELSPTYLHSLARASWARVLLLNIARDGSVQWACWGLRMLWEYQHVHAQLGSYKLNVDILNSTKSYVVRIRSVGIIMIAN